MSSPLRIAFFGLGTMGIGMANRLQKAGFDLTVWNRSADKAKSLKEAGAKVGATAREAAKGADVLISMVADDVASRGVWLGENGALASVSPGAVLVEASTLTIAWVNELNAAAKAKGCSLLDAPVTGTKPHA